MAQQTQPNVSQTQSATQKPVAQTTQPVEGQVQQDEFQKTSIFKKWWFWVILVLVGLGVGAGAYLLFFI